ncbi:MAG TPA: glycosyltransferase family 9 protein, partial [Planctomycetota bacterium]|nr:glycosyltransferase family 9 protein [Planctomycetota bacterium]
MKLAADHLYVRAPNWVGDVVMATPILQAIRDALPRARITIGLRPHLEAVVRGARFFDELHFHPARLGLAGRSALARELAAKRFDAAILLASSMETALVATLARIPRRFGYSQNARGWLLTDRLRPPTRAGRRVPAPMPHYWSDLVALAGVEVRSIRPRLVVDDETDAEVERWLVQRGIAPDERFVLAAPGASFGPSKLWRADRFAQALDALAEELGTKSVVQCGPGEEPIAREIAERCRSHAVAALDPPLDLHRLKAAARRCALVLCTDSGVRHYGVAFDRPVVCV